MSADPWQALLKLRAELGRLRYGVTLAEAGLSAVDLQVHAIEEAADLTLYTHALVARGSPGIHDAATIEAAIHDAAALDAAIARTRAEIARLQASSYSAHQACADLLRGADPDAIARRLGYADVREAVEQIRKDGAR